MELGNDEYRNTKFVSNMLQCCHFSSKIKAQGHEILQAPILCAIVILCRSIVYLVMRSSTIHHLSHRTCIRPFGWPIQPFLSLLLFAAGSKLFFLGSSCNSVWRYWWLLFKTSSAVSSALSSALVLFRFVECQVEMGGCNHGGCAHSLLVTSRMSHHRHFWRQRIVCHQLLSYVNSCQDTHCVLLSLTLAFLVALLLSLYSYYKRLIHCSTSLHSRASDQTEIQNQSEDRALWCSRRSPQIAWMLTWL